MINVEAKLQRWIKRFKDILMITMMTTKDDDKKLKGQSKDKFKMFKKESRTIQDSRGKVEEHFKIQEEGWIQESRFKDQASRIKIKIQDSRFKNQEKT